MHINTPDPRQDRSTTLTANEGDDDRSSDDDRSGLTDEQRSYLRFGAMIATSMVVMFVVMYLNTYQWSHVQWSETRFYMTFVMGAAMVLVMLSFMLRMYTNPKTNAAIYLSAIVVFAGALWLVRSQATIADRSYMRAMIPHHSIAVLTSENADLDDVRVRKLADDIIAAQCREIAEMKWLIADIDRNGKATSTQDAQQRPVPEFSEQC
jgi:hypothetical protein